MKMRTLVLCGVILASSLPAAAAEKSTMKPGKWQITVQTEIPSMPVKIPPVTVSQCITPEQAADPESTLPKGNDKNGSSCKVKDFKQAGGKVTYSFDCPKENMSGSGEMSYSAESYEGVVKMTIGDMQTTAKYNGKYLGACSK